MTEMIHEGFTQVITSFKELYKTPLAFPIILSVCWRRYSGTLTFLSVFTALFVSILVMLMWRNSAPKTLNFQKSALDSFLQSLPPRVLELVKSWHPEEQFLSSQTAILAFTLYSVMMLRSEKRSLFRLIPLCGVLYTATLALTFAWWFALLQFGLANMVPKAGDLDSMGFDEVTKQLHQGVDYLVSAPVAAAAYGMTTWIVACFAATYLRRLENALPNERRRFILEQLIVIIITILILGFALAGFWALPMYQATLWLLFWIIAYPVALAFTRGERLGRFDLIILYKSGLEQIPFLGKRFANMSVQRQNPPVDSIRSEVKKTPTTSVDEHLPNHDEEG